MKQEVERDTTITHKQETLEEAVINHCKLIDDFPALENPIFSFKEGAKWQINKQDEFAIEFGEWLMKKGRYNINNWSKTIEELLETYKNTLPR